MRACQDELSELKRKDPDLANDEFRRWRTDTNNFKAKLGAPSTWTCYSDSHQLRGISSDRERAIVDCGMLWKMHQPQYKGRNMESLRGGLWADISQSVKRKPFYDQQLGTACTSLVYFSYQSNSVMSALGHLRILGHPVGIAPISSFTEADLRDLAGEGQSLPWLTACSITLLAATVRHSGQGTNSSSSGGVTGAASIARARRALDAGTANTGSDSRRITSAAAVR